MSVASAGRTVLATRRTQNASRSVPSRLLIEMDNIYHRKSTVAVSTKCMQISRKTMNVSTLDGSSASPAPQDEGFAVKCAMLDTTCTFCSAAGVISVCARSVAVIVFDRCLNVKVVGDNFTVFASVSDRKICRCSGVDENGQCQCTFCSTIPTTY